MEFTWRSNWKLCFFQLGKQVAQTVFWSSTISLSPKLGVISNSKRVFPAGEEKKGKLQPGRLWLLDTSARWIQNGTSSSSSSFSVGLQSHLPSCITPEKHLTGRWSTIRYQLPGYQVNAMAANGLHSSGTTWTSWLRDQRQHSPAKRADSSSLAKKIKIHCKDSSAWAVTFFGPGFCVRYNFNVRSQPTYQHINPYFLSLLFSQSTYIVLFTWLILNSLQNRNHHGKPINRFPLHCWWVSKVWEKVSWLHYYNPHDYKTQEKS